MNLNHMSTINNRSAIPRHVTAYVGSDNDATGRMYALWKDGQMLIIHASTLVSPEYTHFTEDPAAYKKILTEFNFDLEKIQTLLNTIDFRRCNWAYLVTRNGNYGLVYKHKLIHRISCPTWALFVDERDITITKWITCEDRQGLWNGQEVDILMGWNDRWARIVDLEMKGHRFLRGLDLTFDVLGHVVRDGQVVGLMTEPANGRMVEYSDRAEVYDAITKVQRRGLLYTISCSTVMICDGKVRLLSLSSVRTFCPDAQGLKEADVYHWEALDVLFDELHDHGNSMAPLRSWSSQQAKILLSFPSPQRPLLPDFIRFIIYHKATFSAASDGSRRSSSEHRLSQRSRPRGSRTHTLALADASAADLESPELCTVGNINDLPLESLRFRFRDAHPYSRAANPRRLLLISSDESDKTSESGCSSLL